MEFSINPAFYPLNYIFQDKFEFKGIINPSMPHANVIDLFMLVSVSKWPKWLSGKKRF